MTLPSGLPKYTLGYGVIKWAMLWLRQPNGPKAGRRWTFTPTQIHFILWWYEVDATGRFTHHHGVRRLAKGSGKSPMAAVLAIVEFLGPVRFDGFDPSLPGGVKGKSVKMPWVQIVATSEAQTENTMRVVRAMLPKGGKVASAFGLDVGKTQVFLPPEGRLQVVTSAASTLEGAETTFVVGDETEHWTPSNGGHEISATISDNLAKSGSRMVETCNSWKPGRETVAEMSYEAWLAQEEGLSLNETNILYDARVAPADTDFEDITAVEAALREVYSDCWWVDIKAIMSRIYDPRADPDDSRRKYFNQPSSAGDAWCRWENWHHSGMRQPQRIADREKITLGFDGSLSNDATALIGCRVSDGHVFTVKMWEPRETGVTVSFEQVDAVMDRTFEKYDVVAMFCDVAYWESYVKVHWPKKFGKQVTTWARKGGKDPQPFGFDLRGNQYEWTMAVELTKREIEQHDFTHDDNPDLARHFLNAVAFPNRWGDSIRKRTHNSPDKIDAAVAAILARLARRLYIAEVGKKRVRTGKVIV